MRNEELCLGNSSFLIKPQASFLIKPQASFLIKRSVRYLCSCQPEPFKLRVNCNSL